MSQMGELAGFIRLGPQLYPERTNAVQLIERGPHGQRFAADPVRVRERERGSGFRFWSEEMNVPANQAWNPRQRVTGLLGLGAPSSPDIDQIMVCSAGAPPKPNFGPPPSGGGAARSMWQSLNDVAGAACRGRVAQAAEILEGSWRFWGEKLTASERSSFGLLVQRARDYIRAAAPGAAAREAESGRRERGYSDDVQAWNQEYAADEKRRGREEIECARRGGAAYAIYSATGYCPSGGPFKNPLATVAVVAVGALVVYAVASGFGRGLAGR